MAYEAEISRRSPTAFILLVDQSGSMAEPFGLDSNRSKADFVSDVVNRWVQNLVLRCAKGETIRDYFHVAVLGYGGQVTRAIRSVPEGLIPISAYADNPLRVEDRKKLIDDGTGGVVETTVQFRVWLDPRSDADTPMSACLAEAHDLLISWVSENPDAYPPTVINITDGQATDGDPVPRGRLLTQLETGDGNVLLLNCHISAHGGTPVLYPSDVKGLPDDNAETLFRMSSVLPDPIVDAAKTEGFSLEKGARGFGYQADAAALVKFLDIGTRMKELTVAE
jgi:hypothetical protein